MVIECIGLPGSGKSYLMEKLRRALQRQGYRCVNVSELCMTNPAAKAARKLLRAGAWMDADARKLRADMEEILRAGAPVRSRFGIYEDARYTETTAAVLCKLYPRMMRAKTVFIFDEGLVHALVKYSADSLLQEATFAALCSRTERELLNNTGGRLVVHNHITVRDCIRSIEKRDRHICAFDELRGQTLRGILEAYQTYTTYYDDTYHACRVERRAPMKGKLAKILAEVHF